MKICNLKQTAFILFAISCVSALEAQVPRPAQAAGRGTRIRGAITRENPVELKNHLHAAAQAQFDQGAVPPAFQMGTMTLNYKPSAAQQRALELFLAAQQNQNSPNFHQWLTPEQFADRFGMTQADYDQVSQWLATEGFQLAPATRGRRWISFQGTAGQVEKTFGTSIHRYLVNGELHYANSSNPSVPAALSAMVASVGGLHDFHKKPRLKPVKRPKINFTDGTHGLAPDDFATIYNVAPLYSAGFDGTGQKIAVIGQSNINLSDPSNFRTRYGLPAQLLQTLLVPGETDPGIVPGDNDEANLDIEWSGAVARNATIIFVFANAVNTAVQYAIDNNVAPVITQSYGICEPFDLIDLPATQMLAQQANAQGQTWLNASGDQAAADCEGLDGLNTPAVAQTGLAVDSPASVPEITAVGGTEFNETAGITYWAATNNANGASALSYIPEKVWNDTAAEGAIDGGGGGTSLIFPKPYWQAGPGVPSVGLRSIPDVSLSASDLHVPYVFYSAGAASSAGGTSFATPSMAGIIAILNQFLTTTGIQKQAGVGNINPTLYQLAQSNPTVFHDIVVGGNALPCAAGSPDCVNGTMGYSAGPGFDRASGLGSVDANALVHKWTSAVPPGSGVVPSIDQIPVFQVGNAWSFVLTLSEEAGVATKLTSYTINGTAGDLTKFPTLSIGARNFITSSAIKLTNLTAPTNVVFVFNGQDGNGQTWSRTLTVPFSGVQIPQVVTGAINSASGQQAYAPGMIASLFGTAFGSSVQVATAIPLPDLLAGFEAFVGPNYAPLYYVSPGQVNIQIPYETPTGSNDVVVGNPYDTAAAFTIKVTASAPGIFAANGTTVPFPSVARGGTTTIFITGEGQVIPFVETGDTPPAGTPVKLLPKPRLAQSVTVGGVPANIAFIGIPSGLAGVTQVNFTVAPTTPLGVQPVVVTIGSASSPPVNITVTP